MGVVWDVVVVMVLFDGGGRGTERGGLRGGRGEGGGGAGHCLGGGTDRDCQKSVGLGSNMLLWLLFKTWLIMDG